MTSRRGVALLVVLWIMAILTLLMYAFLAEMQVEYALAGSHGDLHKAEQLAWSAIDLACVTAANDTRRWHGPVDPWANDESRFFEIPLGDGTFTVFHPTYGDEEKVLWGLDDEASKINLNTASVELLRRLPRMTGEIASAIVDWRDPDSTPLPAGAEDSLYQTLSPPYACKNQPFETVEELFYVWGVTAEILYGEDANLNGRLEPNENDGDASWPPDNRDGKLDPGLWPLVTVVSMDKNRTLDDKARINVNLLPRYSAAQLNEAGLAQPDFQVINAYLSTRGPLPSVAHLLSHRDNRGLFTGLSLARFKLLVDKLTTVDGDTIPGLVNINTAPKQALLALPGMTEEIALHIIATRTSPGHDLSTMGWLLEVMEPEALLQVAAFVTFHSYQFRIHAVGRVGTPERPGSFRRMVAVFDKLAVPRPRIVYWKDLTRLGFPYDPEEGPNPR